MRMTMMKMITCRIRSWLLLRKRLLLNCSILVVVVSQLLLLQRQFRTRNLVKEKLCPCDSVLVTGSCEQLGEWTPSRFVPLNRVDRTDDGELWSTNIKIHGQEKIFFRYVIAQIVRFDDDLNLIVKKCKLHLFSF
jgi:hypothetical protein